MIIVYAARLQDPVELVDDPADDAPAPSLEYHKDGDALVGDVHLDLVQFFFEFVRYEGAHA